MSKKRQQAPEDGLTSVGSIMQGLFGESPFGELPQLGLSLSLPFGEGAKTPKEAGTEATKEREKTPQSKTRKSRGEVAGARLAKAATAIKISPHQTQAAYLARELIICTLPHRDPGNVPIWSRQNGNFALTLQPSYDRKTSESIGLPYGSIPRLILLWIVTEATRTKDRKIKLSGNLNEFLREIGLSPGTGRGKRGDATRMKEQIRRLLKCRISFEYQSGNDQKGGEGFLNMEIARQAHLWWDFESPDQNSLFEGEIILGEAFFEAITASPVPLDMRALKALKQSPFALDLYMWATYRVYTLQLAKQNEARIPLPSLKEQFGVEYARADNFKAALEEGLGKVKEVFPGLDYAFEKQMLILRDGKGRRAMPTRAERPALGRAAAQAVAHETVQGITPKGRAWFADNYPRHDIETAAADFNRWREGQGIESANPDAHFRAFVKKWAK